MFKNIEKLNFIVPSMVVASEGPCFSSFLTTKTSTILLAFIIIILIASSSKLNLIFLRFLGVKRKSSSSSAENDATIIKLATQQIATNWIQMLQLIMRVREEQINFESRLHDRMEIQNQMLCKNVSVALDKEFFRNDQRFANIRNVLESIQEDILSTKLSIHKCVECIKDSRQEVIKMNNSSQTIRDAKARSIKEGSAKKATISEAEGSGIVSVVKECITELFKDTKLQISIDREDANQELQIIYAKIAENHEDIKKMIIQTFSMAAERTQKNFEKFGLMGQEAISSITAFNDNTNKNLSIKLKEIGSGFEDISSVLNKQTQDIENIHLTLGYIDGQFDEIFQRVELGRQRNADNCEEMAQSLEKTSKDWMSTTSQVENIAKIINNDMVMIKDILNDIKEKIDSNHRENGVACLPASIEASEILSISTTTTDTLKSHNLILVDSMIQSCLNNLYCIKKSVEEGCTNACHQVETLTDKLQTLNESAEKLNESIRKVNVEDFAVFLKLLDIISEDVPQATMNDLGSGDGQQDRYPLINMQENAAEKESETIHGRRKKIIKRMLDRFYNENVLKDFTQDDILTREGDYQTVNEEENTSNYLDSYQPVNVLKSSQLPHHFTEQLK